MHDAAYQWIRQYATAAPVLVLDIGGRDINGSPRDLFPRAEWVVLDATPGDRVQIVADAATWEPDREYDMVVCAEVFEHTPVWRQICSTAFEALIPGGVLIVTAAGPGRQPHSAVDGGPALRPGEWYANVSTAALKDALKVAGFAQVIVEQAGEDVRAVCVKPGDPP